MIVSMKKKGSPHKLGRSAKSGMIIGRERFAKISAVEGIRLTAPMKKRQAEFDRRGLSGDERRRRIRQAYLGR
jgi:hypothetical protein